MNNARIAKKTASSLCYGLHLPFSVASRQAGRQASEI
jgi:hypothetical protein